MALGPSRCLVCIGVLSTLLLTIISSVPFGSNRFMFSLSSLSLKQHSFPSSSFVFTNSIFPEDIILTPISRPEWLWFQNPPFSFPTFYTEEYQWEAVSISDPKRLGVHETCVEADEYYPCCQGMSHNGGSHAFGPCQDMYTLALADTIRTSNKKKPLYRSGLDFMRSLGNRTLVMVGDSVSHQEFMSLECSCRVWKECKRLSRISVWHKDPECGHWRARINEIETIKLQTDNKTITTLIFIRQHQPCLLDKNTTNATTSNTSFSNEPTEKIWSEKQQQVIANLKPDVLILPLVGAHYAEHSPPKDMFPSCAYDAIKCVFGGTLVKNMLNENKLVIYVEPTQQHPVRRGGDYWDSYTLSASDFNLSSEEYEKHGGAQGCFPVVWEPDSFKVKTHGFEMNEHAWKAKLVRNVFEQHLNLSIWWSNLTQPCQKRQIAWITLLELSRSRPDLHAGYINTTTNIRVCKDPTHICYSPLFWVPFVDSMTRALLDCS